MRAYREDLLSPAACRQWNRVSRAAAQRDLSDLVPVGILEQQGVGRVRCYVLAGSGRAQIEAYAVRGIKAPALRGAYAERRTSAGLPGCSVF